MRNGLILTAMLAVLLPVRQVSGATQMVTGYTRDASGNTTRIQSGANTQAPSVSALDPNAVRRIATNRITATGDNLKNAKVTAQAEGFQIDPVSSETGQVVFDLTADASVVPGNYPLEFATALGTAGATLTILSDTAPVLNIWPNPIGLVANAAGVDLTISLNKADAIDNILYFSIANPLYAQVSPAQIVLQKGQKIAGEKVTVYGLAAGGTELVVNGSQLNSVRVPVQVEKRYLLAAGDYTFLSQTWGVYRAPRGGDNVYLPTLGVYRAPLRGDNAYQRAFGVYRTPRGSDNAYLPPLGVYRAPLAGGNAYLPPFGVYRAPLSGDNAYAQLGVLRAAVIDSVTPTVLAVGVNNPVNLHGINLARIAAIGLSPADGALIDPALEIDPGGTRLTVHILILDGTAPSRRKLVLTTTSGAAVFSQPGGESLDIQ